MNLQLEKTKDIPEWIDIETVASLYAVTAKTIRQKCCEKVFEYRIIKDGKKSVYQIAFDSLPQHIQNNYLVENTNEIENTKYSDAPEWAKLQAEKYIEILELSKDLKGKELKEFIKKWNCNNPDNPTSYPSLMRMRVRYKKGGLTALLSQYKTKVSKIESEYYEYFKNLYLVQGAPSVQSCWEQTFGYAMRKSKVDSFSFPGPNAFIRRLKKEIPISSLVYARKGERAWNKKLGYYIDRDYSMLTCGEVWVSDHAQIDVACLNEYGDKVVFPWVTAWRDYKSGKWLGWILQSGHPNSDFIFQSFYYAALEYGLPKDVIIDNGKDYRCKDFAGKSSKFKITSDKPKTTAMLNEIGVGVHFALPYNAQTKPIERDFLKIKELLSKHCTTYRGGNIVERPEILAENIKKGKILDFNRFKTIFDSYILDVLNKRPSSGKNLKGLSPDELFKEEFKEKIVTSKEALKLFCMRISKPYKIVRNGIKDREFGITYWSEWMVSRIGITVYLRRDINNYKEAWVFRADNDEFIGKTVAVEAVAALHADKISKEEFKTALANKKNSLKITKSYLQNLKEIPLSEQYENYKAAYAQVEKTCNPKITKLANSNMDKAIRKAKEMDEIKRFDMSVFLNREEAKEEELYLFETDRILAEQAAKGVANGY